MARDRHLTAPLQSIQKGPFGRNRNGGPGIVDWGKQLSNKRVIHARFDPQGSLTHSRKTQGRRKILGHVIGPTQPGETRSGQDNRIELAFLKLSKAGVHVSSKHDNAQVRAVRQQLGLPPEAAGSHLRTCRKIPEGHVVPGQ